jgi:hypothetical protein
MDAADVMDAMDTADTMDTVDTVDTMDTNDANHQSDEQYLEQDATLPPLYTETFPGASEIFGQGETYMDSFDNDEHADERKTNLYYPFASQPEWELASYILKSGLSMAAVDEFLKLQMVSASGFALKS